MKMGAPIKIPAELFALAESSRFEGELTLGELAVGPDVYTFAEPVAWDVQVTNTGEAFLVSGRVEGLGQTSCARCLDDVQVSFVGDIEGYFLINAEANHPEDLDDDEFDVLPDDHIIDLEPLIKAALIVEAPAVPLCKEDCLGICPTCGANLNEGPCGCATDTDNSFEEAQNPFAVLKNLSFEEQGQDGKNES